MFRNVLSGLRSEKNNSPQTPEKKLPPHLEELTSDRYSATLEYELKYGKKNLRNSDDTLKKMTEKAIQNYEFEPVNVIAKERPDLVNCDTLGKQFWKSTPPNSFFFDMYRKRVEGKLAPSLDSCPVINSENPSALNQHLQKVKSSQPKTTQYLFVQHGGQYDGETKPVRILPNKDGTFDIEFKGTAVKTSF
jgi:hypothetical protein